MIKQRIIIEPIIKTAFLDLYDQQVETFAPVSEPQVNLMIKRCLNSDEHATLNAFVDRIKRQFAINLRSKWNTGDQWYEFDHPFTWRDLKYVILSAELKTTESR